MYTFSPKDAIWIFLIVTLSLLCWFKPWSEDNNIKTALSECLEDIQKECSSVISYAIALEKENSLLNKKVRRCKK